MQRPDDEDLAAAVEDVERRPVHLLRVDWDRDFSYDHPLTDLTGYVTDISVERDLVGDLPSEATLIEGYASAKLSVTLAGDHPETGAPIMEELAPYRPDSPLFRTPTVGARLIWDVGFSHIPLQVRLFAGHIRTLKPSSSSRRVSLTALDPADKLRAPITLPAYGLYKPQVSNLGHRHTTNTQWVIDHVLRRNGIYASPSAHPQAQIACTAHGSYAAEAGRNAVPRGVVGVELGEDESWWIDGPPQFGMLASRGVWQPPHLLTQDFFAREPFRPISGAGVGIGAWVKLGSGMSNVSGATYRALFFMHPLDDHDAFRFEIGVFDTGRIGGYVYDSIGGFQGAAVDSGPDGWRYVGMHWKFLPDGRVQIKWRVDGITYTGTYNSPALRSTFAARMHMTAWTWLDWCNMHVWYDTEPPAGTWPGEAHTSQATLARGLNELAYLPNVVNADSWQVIQDAAAAEYGVVGFDEFGKFYFRSRATSTTPATVEKEITADRALLDLAAEVNIDSVRNVIGLEAQARYLNFDDTIVNSNDPLAFESPVGVWEYEVPLAHGAIGTATQELPRQPNDAWGDNIKWGFVAVRADDPAVEVLTDVRVTYTSIADRLGLITVRNYSPYPVRFATTGGQAALRVQGYNLGDEPAEITQARSEGSAAMYGERVFPIPKSQWRQLIRQLVPVAGGLLSTLANPLPVISNVPIVGDPRLQLGDTVRLVDPTGQGSFRATVVGINLRFSRGKLAGTLAVRPIAPPGLGIWNDAELGALNDTLILAP